MRAPRVLIALTALIACAGAPAADHRLSDAGSSGIALIADRLDRREDPALELVCRVTTLSTAEVDTPLGRFTELTIPGFATRDVIGAPALPVVTRLVEVPFGADVAATVVASRRVTTSLAALAAHAPIMPRQPPHPKDGSAVPFAFERSAYRMDGRGRDPVVQVEEVGVLRDARLVLLRVSPISYDPLGGRLEVLTEVRIRLTARNVDLSRTARIKRQYGSRSFAALAGVLRPATLRASGPLDAPGDPGYLIVADRMFESALAPFVAWKTSFGGSAGPLSGIRGRVQRRVSGRDPHECRDHARRESVGRAVHHQQEALLLGGLPPDGRPVVDPAVARPAVIRSAAAGSFVIVDPLRGESGTGPLWAR